MEHRSAIETPCHSSEGAMRWRMGCRSLEGLKSRHRPRFRLVGWEISRTAETSHSLLAPVGRLEMFAVHCCRIIAVTVVVLVSVVGHRSDEFHSGGSRALQYVSAVISLPSQGIQQTTAHAFRIPRPGPGPGPQGTVPAVC